jgi:hypothetical protein
MIPEAGNGMRLPLLQIADVLAFLWEKHPEAMKAAMQEFGQKEVKAAMNALEAHVQLWRP